MSGKQLWIAIELSRLPSTGVAFLTVMVPTLAKSHDFLKSLSVAAPMVTIAICTFILNDLHDLERDRINHPARPIPSGRITPTYASVAYLAAFISSLLLIKALWSEQLEVTYVLLMLIALNYNVTVEFLPLFKNVHVALTAAFVIYLASQASGQDLQASLFVSTMLFVFGRELLMDIRDARGDGLTLANRLSGVQGVIVAFAAQCIAAVLLLVVSDTRLELLDSLAGAFLLSLTIYLWPNQRFRRKLMQLMKLQMLVPIAFLA